MGKSGGIDYLLSERNSEKKERIPPAEVLRGNPDLTKFLIDGTPYAQKYTSGVLSFAEYDLSPETKRSIMDSFEKVALFPGLREDQYTILWVQHQDKGRLELHWVVPNQELLSGKRLAPYYHRADMPRVNNWQEVINHDYKLSSPKEPDRKKTITLNGRLPPLKREAVKQINENIEALVKTGTLQSRMDILSFLQEAGFEIARVTPRAISVKNPDGGQNLRLKGALYDETFRDLRSLGEDYQYAQADYQRDLGENVDRAREKLAEQVQRRSDYLTGRYRLPTPELQVRAEPNLERNVAVPEEEFRGDTVSSERCAEIVNEAVVGSHHNRVYHESSIVPGNMGRKQDAGLSLGKTGENLLRESEGDQVAGMDAGHIAERNMGDQIGRESGGKIYRDSPRLSVGLDMRGKTLHQGWEILRGYYDGIRETFADRVRAIAEGFQRAREKLAGIFHEASHLFGRAEQPLTEASPDLDYSCARTDQALRTGGRTVGKRIRSLIDKKWEELRLFKTNINLSQYVASHGYKFDWMESYPNAAVMKNPEGEKIFITRWEGNQWHYFNPGDWYDKGTIIDLVQRQEKIPLGRVREILRPWLEDSPISVPSRSYVDNLTPVSISRQNAIESFYRGVCIRDSPLLEKKGLSPSTLSSERFMGMIWEDGKGNVLFPHYDEHGLSGYEIKGRDFTGFSEEGVEALWKSQKKFSDQRLVIVESAIDALSYHQLHGDTTARYIATGGSMSEHQKWLIESSIHEMPYDSKIVIAFDKDGQGDNFANEVLTLSSSSSFERHVPEMGADWNEELQMQKEKELQQEQQREQERIKNLEHTQKVERERNATRVLDYGMEM